MRVEGPPRTPNSSNVKFERLLQDAHIILIGFFAILAHAVHIPYLGRHHLGFRQFRVRIHGTMARIEVPAEEILKIAVDGAKLLKELADETEGNFQFEYSPESFTGTEPEYGFFPRL